MSHSFAIDRSLFPDTRLEESHLRAKGYSLETIDLREPKPDWDDVAGLVLGPTSFTAAEFTEFPGLRVIGRPGVGLDNIDLETAASRGVSVINAPDYCTEEVATHALALMLACVRRLPHSDLQARVAWADWSSIGPVRALSSLHLGIIGMGRTGRRLAEYAEPLVADISYFDPYVHDGAGTRASAVEELLERADIVSIHAPANSETRGMLSRERLGRMRPGAVLVNIARGGLVDEAALADRLSDGSIAAAGLDVLADEPSVGDGALFTAPNVLFTPHTAWYSTRSEAAVRIDVLNAMIDYLEGRRPTTASLALDTRPDEQAQAQAPATEEVTLP